jgi:UDP-N-acetylmuramyl pentapeptide phosphotransferase/UDP-N-acetylglucosamine-1-phosphate transferase
MGDTGSLLIGMVNAILVIKFINVANNPVSPMPLQAAPALGVAILIVPLFDTLRVFSLRILSRRSPFSPDRNHLHHLMMDHGMSHSSITYTLVGMNILFIAAAYAMRNMNCTWVIALMIATASISTGILYYTSRRHKLRIQERRMQLQDPELTSKILQIKNKTTYIHPEQN